MLFAPIAVVSCLWSFQHRVLAFSPTTAISPDATWGRTARATGRASPATLLRAVFTDGAKDSSESLSAADDANDTPAAAADESDGKDDRFPYWNFATFQPEAERLLRDVARRVLSPESAQALETIRQTIVRLDDHGIIDVAALYPPRDVITSIVALSRLQRASAYVAGRDGAGFGAGVVFRDERLLHELVHYSVYANAAYGLVGALFQSGRVRLGDLETVISDTGIKECDVIASDWTPETNRPVFYIARDTERRTLVLCIRGTLSGEDVLTDLCAAGADFSIDDGDDGGTHRTDDGGGGARHRHTCRAHSGILEAARGVARAARPTIEGELAADPDLTLVVVGHSLGGGAAAVLGTIWRDAFPGLKVYTYGCPCVGPIDSLPTTDEGIVTVVNRGDPFRDLSIGHVADITAALSQLCEDGALRMEVLRRTKFQIETMSDEDLHWSHANMERLRKFNMTAEKFYPPGKIIHMDEVKNATNDEVILRTVPTEAFSELLLFPTMFDLYPHLPKVYEIKLRRALGEEFAEHREAPLPIDV